MAKEPSETDNVQFTITLPRPAVEKLEILIKTGVFGATRAAVASNIILRRLQDIWESGKLPG